MPTIDGYSFGRVIVDGEEHSKDLIVLPNRLVANWWRREGHSLALDDLREVMGELPERLVIGTGAYGQMKPEPQVIEHLREKGVTVEALRTDEAVRRYAELDAGRTAAALHLTC